ncbi:unnamed protein product, partial [Ectocarpus fasciculatus]
VALSLRSACKTKKLAITEEARRVAEAKVDELKKAMATREKAGLTKLAAAERTISELKAELACLKAQAPAGNAGQPPDLRKEVGVKATGARER